MISRLSRWTLRGGVALAALVGAEGVQAQDPDSVVVADTLVADTLVADTLGAGAPPTSFLPDSLMPDTTRIFRRLPDVPGDAPPEALRTGDSWHWDREALLGRPHFTLLELLNELPGVVPLRWGDYGTPEGLMLDGMNGSRVRVFFDGIEDLGLAGSAVDLSRVALVGLESVTVRRLGGELRIELVGLQADEARPLSMIEAGTGDLDTNIFRGTFIQGDALGGALSIGIERVDSQGRSRGEPGSRQGVWLRYLRPFGEHLTIAADLRRAISEQTVDRGPDRLQRSVTSLRARWAFDDDLVAEAYLSRGGLSETGDTIHPLSESVSQYGARLGYATESLILRGAVRAFDGELPSTRIDLDAAGRLPRLGRAEAHLSRESFDGESASLWGVSAETAPVLGLSFFGSAEAGDRGWRGLVDTTTVVEPDSISEEPVDPVDTYVVPTAIGTRESTRAGIRWRGLGAELTAAWMRTTTDSIRPVGTFLDGDGVAFAGDEVEGWQARLRWDVDLPKVPRGFYLDGAITRWDRPGIYRPDETYRAGVGFHRIYYDTGNFELWAGVYAVGRSEMAVPFPDLEAEVEEGDPLPPQIVPFHQSWDAFLQMRIVTVRIFLRFENVTVRRFNQDFPGRLLPQTRAMYGVRWTLFN